MNATVFIATSLDGFIAREDGAIDWLPHDENVEDHGYTEFFASIDTLVMGRNTYELVRTFPGWPYGSKRVVVLTHRDLEIPPELAATVDVMSGSPREIVARLAARGAQHLYVDGGKTVQAFLAEGLIRRMIITRIPVLIGSGIPLFGAVPHDIKLRHIETRSFPSGLVQSEYEIA
jgi:dihydrofolate reductase